MYKLIYLASPYSKYPGGREQAFKEVCKKAWEIMHTGVQVFCPIAHSHPIEVEVKKIGSPEFWLEQDYSVLMRCDELWVYKMPGWEDSYGVKKEIQFAKWEDIPIKYLEYNNEEQRIT